MTQRKTPPFRADHVGSLLRPQELHDARDKARRGEMSSGDLRAVQDKHIREVVAKQESVGMQAVTDGEYRRDWWHIDFLAGFDGVTLDKGDAYGEAKFKGTEEQPPFMLVSGKIRRSKARSAAPGPRCSSTSSSSSRWRRRRPSSPCPRPRCCTPAPTASR